MASHLNAHGLIVEDDLAIQELLHYTLTRAGYEVTRATSAEHAHNQLADTLPDFLLVDWMLPGQSGQQFVRQVRAHPRTRNLPIIMVTARGEETDRIKGLEDGADDYIVKPFSPKELVARVQALLRRRAPDLAEETLTMGPIQLNSGAHEASVNGRVLGLTPIEFRLLRFLMANPNRVYSRAQLLDQVWGDDVYVEERTVDVHIRRLRVALGDEAQSMIETIRGSGYKMTSSAQNGA